MDVETILYEVKDGKAYVTLNRPEKLNALSPQLQQEVHAVMWEADNDTDVHVVILRAAGRAFSTGYDIGGSSRDAVATAARSDGPVYRGSRSADDDSWQLERSQRLRMAIWDMHKPVIAQVHGYCLAGGTDLAFLCDMIIAADDALFGFPATRAMGTPPAHMWTYLAGPQWAKRLLLTGDSISGADAARIGLVLQAVPATDLAETVEDLANKLAMIDPELLAAQKRIVNLALELMGARTIQRLAVENDARSHTAPAVAEFRTISQDKGLKAALEWRDSKFGDGRASPDAKRRRTRG